MIKKALADKQILLGLYFLLAAFILILTFDYAHRMLLGVSDDITHISLLEDYQNGLYSTSDVFKNYLTEPARQQRPLSGFFIAMNTVLGQHSVFAFYFIKFIYVVIFMISFRIFLRRETKDEFIIFLILLFSAIFPLGAGVYYVVIMWQMYWVLPIYFMHLYLLYNDDTRSFLLSGLLFLICMFFNEYVVFLAPFVLYLILVRIPTDKKVQKLILAFVIPIILAFIYRYYLVDIIYGNTYKFDEKLIAFTSDNFIRFIATTVKFLSVYWMSMMKNSFISIQFYTVWDYMVLLIAFAISSIIITLPFFKKTYIIKKKDIVLVILLFFLTFSFCAVTFYKPYISAFNTRIFCMGLFVFPIMATVIILAIKNIFLRQMVFFVLVMCSSITLISQKNAWLFASELNSKISGEELMKNADLSQSKTILIAADLKKYSQFVIEEPALSHLGPVYKMMHHKYVDIDEIKLLPSSGDFMGFKYDRNQPNFYYTSPETIRIRNRTFRYPFYIFDYDAKTIQLIVNKQALERYQRNYQNVHSELKD